MKLSCFFVQLHIAGCIVRLELVFLDGVSNSLHFLMVWGFLHWVARVKALLLQHDVGFLDCWFFRSQLQCPENLFLILIITELDTPGLLSVFYDAVCGIFI